MKPIKILRLNRKHLSQMTYYFTSFQDNSCSHDGQSSICRIHSMQYIPVTPNMRDYNLLDSLGVAPDLERILDYAMLYGATYVELTGNDADIDPLLPTFKWTLDNAEFDEISEIIPISPEDYQKSIKYEDVCTSARN